MGNAPVAGFFTYNCAAIVAYRTRHDQAEIKAFFLEDLGRV